MLGLPGISIADLLRIRKNALHAYSVGLLQGKAYRVLEKNLTLTLQWYGLSIVEWKCLGQLVDNETLSVKELSEKLDVSTVNVKKIGRKLEKQAYVVFKRSTNTFSIAQQGRELSGLVEIAVKEKMLLLLAGLSKRELLTYLKVLMRIVDNG